MLTPTKTSGDFLLGQSVLGDLDAIEKEVKHLVMVKEWHEDMSDMNQLMQEKVKG